MTDSEMREEMMDETSDNASMHSASHAEDESGARLERLLGDSLDGSRDTTAYDDVFVQWLQREASANLSTGDRRENSAAAGAFATRVQSRLRAVRAGENLRGETLRVRDAGVVGSISRVMELAASARCAPWIDTLTVAAGVGREMWDEECERWIELPRGISAGSHVALTVSGDSMMPYLEHGDVILVDTGARVTRDSIVVARRPDHGYIVKHLTRLGRSSVELSSFNSAYPPFTVTRVPGAIVGVVTARLVRTT